MEGPYVVYGSPGSGSVPVEAALTLVGAHYYSGFRSYGNIP